MLEGEPELTLGLLNTATQAWVTVASLLALERALLLEHSLPNAPPSSDDPTVRARARALLRCASRLRRALRVYRGVVDAIAREADHDDGLF